MFGYGDFNANSGDNLIYWQFSCFYFFQLLTITLLSSLIIHLVCCSYIGMHLCSVCFLYWSHLLLYLPLILLSLRVLDRSYSRLHEDSIVAFCIAVFMYIYTGSNQILRLLNVGKHVFGYVKGILSQRRIEIN